MLLSASVFLTTAPFSVSCASTPSTTASPPRGRHRTVAPSQGDSIVSIFSTLHLQPVLRLRFFFSAHQPTNPGKQGRLSADTPVRKAFPSDCSRESCWKEKARKATGHLSSSIALLFGTKLGSSLGARIKFWAAHKRLFCTTPLAFGFLVIASTLSRYKRERESPSPLFFLLTPLTYFSSLAFILKPSR